MKTWANQQVSLISIKHSDLTKPINNDPYPNFDFIQNKEAIFLI